MIFYALRFAWFCINLCLYLCELSSYYLVLYTYLKAVMFFVCHSSSKVIEAVYFILMSKMANEVEGTSFDIDQVVSEAVARAMSTMMDSILSVINTRLQVFQQDNSQS